MESSSTSGSTEGNSRRASSVSSKNNSPGRSRALLTTSSGSFSLRKGVALFAGKKKRKEEEQRCQHLQQAKSPERIHHNQLNNFQERNQPDIFGNGAQNALLSTISQVEESSSFLHSLRMGSVDDQDDLPPSSSRSAGIDTNSAITISTRTPTRDNTSMAGTTASSNRGTPSDDDSDSHLLGASLKGGECITSSNTSNTERDLRFGPLKPSFQSRGKGHPPAAKSKARSPAKNDAEKNNIAPIGEGTRVYSRSEADNMFLRALRGENSVYESDKSSCGNENVLPFLADDRARTAVSATSSEQNVFGSNTNDNDSAFLKALRGETGEKKSSGTMSSITETPISAIETNNGGQLADPDHAFLNAIQATNHTHGDTRGSSMGRDLSDYTSGENNSIGPISVSFLDGKSQISDDIAYANAAFLGALHASSDPPDDIQSGDQSQLPQGGGTFVFNSKQPPTPDRFSNPNVPSYAENCNNADSSFLLAMQGLVSPFISSNERPSLEATGEWQDSGTLILNSNKPEDKRTGQNALDEANSSFVMSIHSSDDDMNGLSDGDVKEDFNAETEDEEDDDMEGVKVPSFPYIERVILPRPLFFGNSLPPRVIGEAELAAKRYGTEYEWKLSLTNASLDKSVKSNSTTVTPSKETLQYNVSEPDRNSVLSRKSMSTFDGKKYFEPRLPPCACNLEGAIDAFGFGFNPFSSQLDQNAKEEESTDILKTPHPYLSLYSPVWGDYARLDRAKAKRKKVKLLDENKTSTDNDLNVEYTKHMDRTSKMRSNTTNFNVLPSTLQKLKPREDDPSLNCCFDEQVSPTRKADSTDTKAMSASSDNAPTNVSDKKQYFEVKPEEKETSLESQNIDIKSTGTFILEPQKAWTPTHSKMYCNTFVQAVKIGDAGSDDDDYSIEAAEERKAVGLNDNITAAAAMLAGEGVDDDEGDENVQGGIGTSMFMAVGGGAKAANKYGRPYTNLELTHGCTPQFGCDDPSLPHESDLGIFETKEDEKQIKEKRKEKNLIEGLAVPGIMLPVVCPTQCTDVDDSQSWNSRAIVSEGGNIRSNNDTVIISLDDAPTHGVKSRNKALVYEASRFGWWNIPDGLDEVSKGVGRLRKKSKKCRRVSPTEEVFPAFDDPVPLDVITNLYPPPRLLQENNFSATRLHSATTAARFLPHLSDRPPSVRHLQIDTTAVGFPKLGGEIEPMFCKLTIYHFEMKSIESSLGREDDSISTETGISSSGKSLSAVPKLERCGRVTETLSFDVVQDPVVIENCKRALWPYANEAELHGLYNTASSPGEIEDNVRLEGTPCGVFTLPGHLNMSNLYAVITVHKVLSDSVDLLPYLKPNRRDKVTAKHHEDLALDELRENARKASDYFGPLICPFAFGVVPLMHIIGNESPKVPISRAVQIPLFKFKSGLGPQPILDHILVMLHPRADRKVGNAAAVTRGHALLVMRYFGFLGLHSIIEKRSSLARERLVDFTGELQVTRGVQGADIKAKKNLPDIGNPYIIPHWKDQYLVEPTLFGGRNLARKFKATLSTTSTDQADAISAQKTPEIYAQELAALPLEYSCVETGSSSSSSNHGSMFLHTSFCNELICQPKMLMKCSKKNIVIKVELRKLQWSEILNQSIAMPVEPSIHNSRRGPWLVQEAFTSYADVAEPQFLDEFKIKLPLIIGESYNAVIGIFFSVYHVDVKKSTIDTLHSSSFVSNRSDYGLKFDKILHHIGSGFLPFTSKECPTCLLRNGDYNIPIRYKAVELKTQDEFKILDQSSRRHQVKTSVDCNIGIGRSDGDEMDQCHPDTENTKDVENSNWCYPDGTLVLTWLNPDKNANTDNDEPKKCDDGNKLSSDRKSQHAEETPENDSSTSARGKQFSCSSVTFSDFFNSKDFDESIGDSDLILKVNIVAFSSVHPQNKVLSDLFILKPDSPRCVISSDFSEPYSLWGKYRSEILYRLKPDRIPPFNFVGGTLAETERKFLEPVVALSKSSQCPAYEVIPHLVRVTTQLWRTMVAGIGEPSILWASPESLIPLRLNAFASLLHVVSSASHHMAKAGLRQIDGNVKWNLSALGTVLSMLFDESKILEGPLEEIPVENDEEKPSPSMPTLSDKKPPLLSSRSKTCKEPGPTFSTKKPQIIQRFSSEDNPTMFDVDTIIQSLESFDSVDSQERKDDAKIAAVTSQDSGLKVDSKIDFMSTLRLATMPETDVVSSVNEGKSGRHADNMLNSRNSLSRMGSSANKRRWMTLPLMATIQESDTEDNRMGGLALDANQSSQPCNAREKNDDILDTELVLHAVRTAPKQFRVPEFERKDANNDASSILEGQPLPEPQLSTEVLSLVVNPETRRILPENDDDIESAGTVFLDLISRNMGFQNKEPCGEDRRVGAAHHRKTKSKCSIDWTLPPTDTLLEKDQQIELLNRTKTATPMLAFSPLGSFAESVSEDDNSRATISNEKVDEVLDVFDLNTALKVHPLKRHRLSFPKDHHESVKSIEPIALPDYADRISAIKNDGSVKRWWPYVYEVIIYQWLTLLTEQTKKGENNRKASDVSERKAHVKSELSPIVSKYLSQAARAARGATIRCAPYLLEIIKQSLSWRIDSVLRQRNALSSLRKSSNEEIAPHLMKLDTNIYSVLEKLIKMLTDASIDSRNFDSFEFRKISIDVNDAVVRFLRDLFSMLDMQSVHRLILIYFSRFVTKEGKHWHDHDSKTTGLNCSWETTKLRLNAVTLFIRFPDFMKVNVPLMDMEPWKSRSVGSSIGSSRRFFSDALDNITQLGLSELTSPEGPTKKDHIEIPEMKPHWLAELCTDICLSATGHAEENIQHRASSLLFELFWRQSQEGRAKGNTSVVASVFVPFVLKVLLHMDYLSSFHKKCQLRKDIIPCVLFVLQSAPVGLMRALWRKLAKQAEGKSQQKNSAIKYGGIIGSTNQSIHNDPFTSFSNSDVNFENDNDPDILDMFGLLNLSLSTIEYEGCEQKCLESNSDYDESPIWRKEFLLSVDREQIITAMDPRRFCLKHDIVSEGTDDVSFEKVSTRNSRKWHAHDCSMVIINICRQVVRETLSMLKPSMHSTPELVEIDSIVLSEMSANESTSKHDDNISAAHTLRPAHDENEKQLREGSSMRKSLTYSPTDTVIFVRAATSVYLHALTMRQSDVVIAKTLTAVVEIVKIFGIKVFLSAVGETLQHWMRVTLEHCGARRAEVRVDASEFLNFLLRLTWDSYGSFSRVRLPLLSVQTEVMQRIVAKAAVKYAKEQRSRGLSLLLLSNESAEACLTPLWRTIDRLHNQSASRNLSFKSALARLAVMMKKLYKAYLAAHALDVISRSDESGKTNVDVSPPESNPYILRMRVSVHRIVSNAAGYSRQFLGNQANSTLDIKSIQTEAVEDSLLLAANVFSPTELPSHRVAFLQKLAEFHKMRGRLAEEATCRFYIYHTFCEATKQHKHIWCSSPFFPWASPLSDGLQVGAEGATGEYMGVDDMETLSIDSSKHEENSTSFRRIFYRAPDSVCVRTGDWARFGGGRFLFNGVTLKSEFDFISPWYSLREMEEAMIEEAEISGDLFLKAGIVESSRYAWSIATHFYSETFNYARLAHAYRRLAQVVTYKFPVIDTTNQHDMSSQIGRFYKVYFHGGAPDDLLQSQGSEGFIYRVSNSVQMKDFAARLENTVRSILPSKSTIDLVLDDGSPTQVPKAAGNKRQAVIGGATVEPIKIKVTPLRPLFKMEDSEKCFRGTPEWFQLKTEECNYISEAQKERKGQDNPYGMLWHQRQNSLSTNTISSTGSTTLSNRLTSFLSNYRSVRPQNNLSNDIDKGGVIGEAIGVDRFYFTQPQKKDPIRGFRDWLKVPTGNFAERSLRVTELQVENCFPACVTRQKIIHRAVFTQSPLEAGVEAVSTWCSVLFRTIMATNGLSVLKGTRDQCLSASAAKVLADCIHSSGVKQIGLSFLSVNPQLDEPNNDSGFFSPYETLSDDEIEKVQTKLARIIVTFLELLHLLIARNRNVLLALVQSRKQRGGDSSTTSGSAHDDYVVTSRTGHHSSPLKVTGDYHGSDLSISNDKSHNEILGKSISTLNQSSYGHQIASSDRSDAAIVVQSELQRGFISLVKALYPSILDTINNEVPRWLRQCCQDNYFSTGMYRQAEISIGEELFFYGDPNVDERGNKSDSSFIVPRSITRGSGHIYKGTSPSNSICGTEISYNRKNEGVSSSLTELVVERSRYRENASASSHASLRAS